MKTPDVYSAAVTARVISRMLKKAGFKMSSKADPKTLTEGIYANRLGCSNFVVVDYWIPRSWSVTTLPETKAHGKAERQRALDLLVSKGYVLNSIGYVICENP